MAAKAEEYAGVAALPEDSQVETVAASVDVVNAVSEVLHGLVGVSENWRYLMRKY